MNDLYILEKNIIITSSTSVVLKYAKSLITGTLIISFLIMFYPYYSYSFLGFNNPEEKNSNPELLNKIIEPTITSVSLNKLDIDIDDLNINDNEDIECFENDDDEIVCFDKNANNNIDDLNINDNEDIECFENDDDEIVCFDKNAINDDGSLFLID